MIENKLRIPSVFYILSDGMKLPQLLIFIDKTHIPKDKGYKIIIIKKEEIYIKFKKSKCGIWDKLFFYSSK